MLDVLVTLGEPRVAPLVSCLNLPRPEFGEFIQVSAEKSEEEVLRNLSSSESHFP